ncbi:MAG: inositol monophosphatase family protein [archaeon]
MLTAKGSGAKMEKSRELKTAISAAKKAGKIILERMESRKVAELKGKADLSTDSDIESERAIIGILEKEFPGHNILSEESKPKEKNSEFTWIIDPLDGTKNYFRKLPLFTVSIALAMEKEIVLGVVFDPSAKRLYYAEKGKGAFLNGKRIGVSKTKSLDKATVFFDYGHLEKAELKALNKMAGKVNFVRNFGLGSLGLCYVAQGGYDAYIGGIRTKIVDIAAAELIAREAGAEISGRKGEKVDLFKSREIIASNGLLHKGLLKFFE